MSRKDKLQEENAAKAKEDYFKEANLFIDKFAQDSKGNEAIAKYPTVEAIREQRKKTYEIVDRGARKLDEYYREPDEWRIKEVCAEKERFDKLDAAYQ